MTKLLTWAFLPIFTFITIIAPSVGYAQNVAPYSSTKIINAIINGTPGIGTVHVPGRTTVTANGSTIVNKSPGFRIPVPATATATANAAAMAGKIGRALRAGTFVGAASFVIPWIADQYGIKICPPPAFFCMPGPPEQTTGTAPNTWRRYYPAPNLAISASPVDHCLNSTAHTHSFIVSGQWVLGHRFLDGGRKMYCNYVDKASGAIMVDGVWAYEYTGGVVCPAGTTIQGGICVKPGPDIPATVPALETAVAGAMNTSAAAQGSMYDGMVANNIPVFAGTEPVTVSAPAVKGAPEVKVEHSTAPNGDALKTTTTTQTTVTPVITGTTLNTTNITYPAVTTTTTIINNITNNTEAPPIIDTSTEPATPDPEPEKDLPKDYNKEKTQIEILNTLKGEGITTKVDTNMEPHVKPVNDAILANKDAATKVAAGDYGIVSWMPQIPTAACKNPTVPNAIGPGTSEIDICKPVDVFKTFISGVICFFVMLGCVREIQSALKA